MSDELVQRIGEEPEPHGVSLALTPAWRVAHNPEARYVAVHE